MRLHNSKSRRGFSLLELLGVVTILGVIAAIIGLIVIFSVASSQTESCRGGIDRMQPPTYDSTGNHWTATYQCNNGGSTTKPIPANRVTGGGR